MRKLIIFIINILLAAPVCGLTLGSPEFPSVHKRIDSAQSERKGTNCTVTVASLQTLIGALCENAPPNEALV